MEENYSYLHFTNNDAFENIIRNESLRLYNYESLSDKFEISLPLAILLKEIYNPLYNTFFPKDNVLLMHIFENILNIIKLNINNAKFENLLENLLFYLYDIPAYNTYNRNRKITTKQTVSGNLGIYLLSLSIIDSNIINRYKDYLLNSQNTKHLDHINLEIYLNNNWERYGAAHQGVSFLFSCENIKKIISKDNKFEGNNINYKINNEEIMGILYFKDYQDENKILKEYLKHKFEDIFQKVGVIQNEHNFKFDYEIFNMKKANVFRLEYNHYLNELYNLILRNASSYKMETFVHENEFRLSVTKNINDEKNIKNFKTDPERNTTYYELDISDIFTVDNPLEVIIGYRNEKFLNTSYRETFQREFPFVKFLM